MAKTGGTKKVGRKPKAQKGIEMIIFVDVYKVIGSDEILIASKVFNQERLADRYVHLMKMKNKKTRIEITTLI